MKLLPPGTRVPLFFSLAFLGALVLLNVFLSSREKATSQRADTQKISKTDTVPVVHRPPQAVPQTPEPLPDFDVRAGRQSAATFDGEGRGVELLKQEIPNVQVDFDPVTKSPKWIGSNSRLLTGPQPELAAQDKDAPIKQFIDSHRELFGHGAEALSQARRVTDYSTPRSNSRKVVWHQQHEGIDIFEAVLQANLSADSSLINIGSQFMASPQAADAAVPQTPHVSVEQAVAAAGRNVGENIQAESIRPMAPVAARPDLRQQFRAALLTDADARLTWLPMDAATLRLAWDVTLTSRSRSEMFRVLVDAATGEILVRHGMTAYISDATYRVFTTESPTPFSPGHQTPSSLQPLPVSRVLVTTPALNTTASPGGWINDGGNITSGNNADAYTDVDNNNVADLPRTTGSPNRVFDFPHDLTQEPANLKDASVTQLFYWTNFMHDRMYELGFTEAAGNFQTDNFGRGGLGNDPVNSEAQDGSGTNNANFSTPVDGGRGRMQMFNWTNPTPDRDGSFEAEVVLHEYGHGVSNRLVGGPSVTISSLATRGMGEGWSDFYGLALTAEATDNPHGNWSRAGWSRYLTSGWLSENYYYGARRYSYSTDMTKNPHTFRDIDPNLVDWHVNVPRNPTYAATQDASQVHYVGTVWATTLWDMRANLILKHGFAIGNERALFLVTEGMKLGPANPNFVQARDGILQAALVSHPADLGEVWTAFAKRGMGDGAAAPVSTTTTGITEQHDLPDGLEINDRTGWNITGSALGGFLPATKALTLSNDSAATVNWTAAPNASWLSISPAGGSLAPGANVSVTVTTQAGAMPAGFHSTNIVFSNTGTGFMQPIGVRLYVTPPAVHAFDLDSNPGWTTTGQWAHGTPGGSGGTAGGGAGNPDPSAGATGSNVYGVNLGGNAATTVGGPFYLTSTPVNLSARQATRLRFKRWLNSSTLTSTRMTVQISTNGTDWRELFVNPGTAITDNAWQTLEYDISSIADQQPAVQVRWGYQNLVSTTAYSGWNIDDIEFLGEPSVQFSLDIAASVSEGSAPVTATLNLNLPQPGPITVTLGSSNPAAATVQPSVTLAAGELSKTFTITPVNDTELDGVETTLITATAAGIAPGSHLLAVADDETATLSLSAPANINEGTSGHSASVSVSAPPTKAVTVQLSADSSRVSLPVSVTLPAGSTGPVPFIFDSLDNQLAEGAQNVSITASVAGWTPGTALVGITDDEAPTIALTGPAATFEGSVPLTCTVTVNTVQAADRVLNLSSSDAGELAVPATVTIPAGQFNASFDASVVDDSDFDGVQSAVVTASGPGYAPAALHVSIRDNEVSSYTLGAIPSPQRRNVAFPVSITVRDINGDAITSHTGSVTLTSASPGGVVPFTTSGPGAFSQGTATIDVTVTAIATAMTLTATDAGGKSGTSNSFNVEPVTHAGFAFTTPGSATPDTLFNITARAVDDQGNTYTGYTDSTVLDVLCSFVYKNVGSTLVATTTSSVHNTAAHDSRVQIIYTAAELGTIPQLFSSLLVSKAVTGGQPMENYAVRLKHTTLENFDGQSWEEGGWTTVYTSSSFAASGSVHLLIKPFAYDGVRNLMVDISFDNASASTAGTVRQIPATSSRMLFGTSDSTHGSPLSWTAASGPTPATANELPVMSFFVARSVGPLPASPATFANGTWSGQALTPSSCYLRATAPSGAWGTSNYIVSVSPSAPVGTDTLFTDGFETGLLGASWNIAENSGATARTQVTTANTPKTGTYHLTMDTTSTGTGTFATNRPTLTLNLAGKKNVSLEWYQKGFSEESHSPVLAGPLGTFGNTSNHDGVSISQDGVTWVQAAALTVLPGTYSSFITRVQLDPIIQRLGWSYNSTFRVRFSQYDDQAIPGDGIALDDVAVKANPAASIGLSLPATINEGTLNVPVTVTLPAAAASSTSVALVSNAPGRLSVVSPVVIPTGQTTGSTTISAPQNFFAEEGRAVIITASATGQTTAYHNIRVVDDEQPVIVMTLPPSVTEGGAGGSGTLSLEPAHTQPTTIYLTSGATGDATVTNSVTLSGSVSATFLVSPVNDTRLDGTQRVTITASGQGLVAANGTLDVLDNESTQIVVTAPPPLTEGGSPRAGSVGIAGPRTVETVVNLTSSDLTEATVPTRVTIPAGQLSANFQATPVEDSLQDGQQTVTITASASGLLDGTASLTVQDNDPASFEWTVIPSPQTRNAPFTVTLTAKDDAENIVTGFNGTVTLTAQAGAAALPVTPATTAAFVNGIWTGDVTVGGTGSGVTLLATGSDGAAGSSDAFEVVSGGAPVALAFDAVPLPQAAGGVIPVRVRAVDAAGLLVNEVTGPVTVSLVTSPDGVVVASASLTLVDGAAATTFVIPAPLPAVRLEAATATLQGQGAVFAITAPALLYYPAPEVVFEDGFETGSFKPEWVISGTATHRTQISTANGPRSGTAHLVMDSSTDVNLSRNEATLTLNLAGKSDVALSFWMKESGDEDHGPPTAPFVTGANFDGVAISADGNTWHEVQGLRSADGIGTAYKQFTLNLSTAAAARGLTLNSAFKIRFNHYDDYTYGTDGFAFDDIRVEANGFAPPEPVVTLFADDFETGVFKPQWAITGTNNHRTEVTAQQTPRGGYHMVMDVHTTGDSRNEATLTLDTSAHRDVVLKFWMKENSDEDQAPATNPFTGGADYDGVAISVNGTTWYEVQPLRGTASTSAYQEFTVDVDAALNTWGLSHGPNLRIRFNHFDNSAWASGDGFAFDDILITGRPQEAVTLELPAAVAEGADVSGRVRIPTGRAGDTVVTLTTNRPGSLGMPANVTIPAGSTVSADFTVAAVQNSFLTGTQKLQVVASTNDLRRGAAEIEIMDDELAPGLDVTLPASLAEGGSINGGVAIATASLFDLPVALSAAPSLGLTLPATVTIPAGGTSTTFTLSKPENQTVLEPATTLLTARLAATTDTAVLSLGDNDAAVPLAITLPASVSESADLVAGSVGFAPPILCGRDLVISLSSSNAGTLSVPTTVTLPAGSGSVSFNATPQDNALADGARVVTVTAAAAGVTGDTHDLSVQDDEVHHLDVDAIGSPQIALQPFSVTLRARTIDNQTVSGFTGTAALSAANAGGAVAFTPSTTSAFTSGVWTGQITFPNPVTGVLLTATAPGGTTGSSNIFNVVSGPRLVITPSSINTTLPAGETATPTAVSLSNPGAQTANWNALVTYQTSAGQRSLAAILDKINTQHASITSLIPSRYDFTDGVTGTSISDGGGDMYDGGNYLNTNLTAGALSYSDNVIVTNVGLGSGGQYFTRKQPGLFVFAADVAGLSHFEITGDLGADGAGSTNSTILTSTRSGTVFKGYVKRVYGAGKPSVNHLIIMQGNGAATHTAATNTNDDQHRLSGLTGVTRLYYLLYATSDGSQVTDAQTQAIMDKFLDHAVGQEWLTLSSAGGSVAAGGNASIQATLTAAGLPEGTHQATVRFTSNDPVAPQQDIPVTLNVAPAVASFQWNTVPSPQSANVPFATTLTAKSAGGSTVSAFNGRANVIGQGPVSNTVTGTGTGTTSHCFYGSFYQNRVQAIYTPAEVGGPKLIQSIALDVVTAPGVLNNFTVRAKHTSKASYAGTGNAAWETAGWTTLHTGAYNNPATGYVSLPLSAPFNYDGVSNLMLDISFNNGSLVNDGTMRITPIATASRCVTAVDYYSAAPLTWAGSTPAPIAEAWLPNVRFTGRVQLPATPASVVFTNGVWTGNMAVEIANSQASLLATSASRPEIVGESNVFATNVLGTLSISAPATGTEGGSLIASVTASVAPASNLTVTLSSSDTSEATVPATVTILAGQTSAAFAITLPDEALLDGPQPVSVKASAPAYSQSSAALTVQDNDTTTVTVTLPATINESSATTAGQASVNLAMVAGADLTLSLSSSSSRVAVPATVIVPAGQNSVGITLTAPNNGVIDGNENVIITATLAGSPAGTGTVQVLDNEARTISMSLNISSLSEGAAPYNVAGTVSVTGTVTSPLVITLGSSDTTEVTVQPSITIPTGSSSSNYFTFTPVNDTLFDGSQTVTITASAATFTNATRTITILDDDAHHFTMSAVGTTQIANAPFSITATAKDVNDVTIFAYAGTANLTVGGSGGALPITPATLTGFNSGSKTQSVTINGQTASATITATDSVLGGSGTTNTFALGVGTHSRFGWNTISSPQPVGTAFPVTVKAQDGYGNTVPNFTSTATFSAVNAVSIGTAGTTLTHPFYTYYDEARTQVIYTAAEIGAARNITGIALDVQSLPSVPMSNFKIRLRHTSKSDYTGTGNATWETTSWTTCLQTTQTISATGWHFFTFTTPFVYDGSQNVMVDVSFSNSQPTFASGGSVRATAGPTARTLYYSTSYSSDPLTWSGTTPTPTSTATRPDIRFMSAAAAPSPATTGAFTAGVWTGNLSLPSAESTVMLQAANGVITGWSNPFTVSGPPALSVTLPATAAETAGTVAGTISLSVPQASDLVVSLTSDTPAEAQPAAATVTIPAGATSVPFVLTVFDDTDMDGDRPVVITATAAEMVSGAATVTVQDNELHHFTFTGISAATKGTPFNLTILAQNASNRTLPEFNGVVNLSAAASGAALPMTPATSGAFTNGVWAGSVTINLGASGVVLTATHASGRTGTSLAITVAKLAATKFAWSSQPSAVTADTAFPVTITAVDANGDPGTYTGTATLSLANPPAITTTIGAGAFLGTVPLYAAQPDTRSQVLYKQHELGAARRLTSLAFNIGTTSSFVYNQFTLRLKHTTRSNFNTAPTWETDGWTTVWQGSPAFNTAGWQVFTFTTPFDYDGSSSLMLDISMDNTTTGSSAWLRRDPAGHDTMMVYQYTTNATAPTAWSGTTPSLLVTPERPQIRFVSDSGLSITPTTTGAFTNGAWTGSLTFSGLHPALVLQAGNGSGFSGVSAPISSGLAAPVLNTEPTHTGGTANTVSWSTSAGAGGYVMERGTTAAFDGAVQSSSTPATSAQASALQDGQAYHYRVKSLTAQTTAASVGEWQQTTFDELSTSTHADTSAAVSLHDVTLAPASTGVTTWTEDFDESGTTWSNTLFSVTGIGNNGSMSTLDRQIMTTGPSTTPALPVNQGGDKEGRVGTDGVLNSAYMLPPLTAEHVFADGSIEGYMVPEGISGFFNSHLLFRARLSSTNTMLGYSAMGNFGTSSVTFGLQLLVNGILNSLGTSTAVAYTASDNFKVRIAGQGSTLTMQVWKVSVTGGTVTETPQAIFGGSTTLTVSNTAYTSGRAGLYFSAAAGRCYFDDVVVTKNTPVYKAAGLVTSPVVAPAYKTSWGVLRHTLDTTAAGTNATVDVLDAGGGLLAADVASGTDLSSLPALTTQTALRLRANLASSNSANTPYLRDWAVGYQMSPAGPASGPWSNTVSSTQDASPPVLTVPELTTGGTSATLAGTAMDATSGVATVTVNGNAATTATAFANWTRGLAGLTDGANSFTVSASDNAVPANTTSVTAMVYRIASPTGDGDGNGISSLLEHALGIPAAAANPRSMLPAATVQTDGGTGEKFLTLQFRRRIQHAGLTYTVETSTNLTTWDNTGASVQEMSAVPTGDGMTEMVTVRVTPGMSTAGKKFVRLSVMTN
ncbi:MAG: M36 family metallopeptidase [Prosthecobacter sp.]